MSSLALILSHMLRSRLLHCCHLPQWTKGSLGWCPHESACVCVGQRGQTSACEPSALWGVCLSWCTVILTNRSKIQRKMLIVIRERLYFFIFDFWHQTCNLRRTPSLCSACVMFWHLIISSSKTCLGPRRLQWAYVQLCASPLRPSWARGTSLYFSLLVNASCSCGAVVWNG